MIAALIAIGVMASVGVPIARLLDRDAPATRFAGEAFLCGSGFCALTLFAFGIARVRWSLLPVLTVIATVAVLLLIHAQRLRRSAQPSDPPFSLLPIRRSLLAPRLIDLATAIILLGYARFATAAPMWELDFLDNWGLKGRVFWERGGFDWPFLSDPSYRWSHQDYPPLAPLMFDFMSLVAGRWEDRWIGLLYVALGVAVLLVTRSYLLETIDSPLFASLGTLAMTCLVVTPWPGLADGLLVAYGLAGLLLIRRGALAPGSVLLGLAALSKNEGMTLIVAAGIGLAAERRLRAIATLWPAAAMVLPWLALRSTYRLTTDLATGSILERAIVHLRHPEDYLRVFGEHPVGQPLLWIGIALAILPAICDATARERFLLVTAAAQILFYVAAYVITPLDVAFHVRWSWDRLVGHVAPLLAFVALTRIAAEQQPRAPAADPEEDGQK